MNSSGGKPAHDSMYVRPVIEEFKAFVQHKIEVLEKFRNVDEIKVYLDALELGIKAILDVQAEDVAEPARPTEIEFTGDAPRHDLSDAGGDDSDDSEVLVEEESIPAEDAESGPGIETEELETHEGITAAVTPSEEDVLVGEEKPPEPQPEQPPEPPDPTGPDGPPALPAQDAGPVANDGRPEDKP